MHSKSPRKDSTSSVMTDENFNQNQVAVTVVSLLSEWGSYFFDIFIVFNGGEHNPVMLWIPEM